MPKSVELLRSPPTQARSKEALERFINAAEKALHKNTFEQASIAELAVMAKSSVGTFYRLFTDKEVLFRLLHNRLMAEAQDSISEALDAKYWKDQGSAADILEALVKTLVGMYANKEGLIRALIIRSSSDIGFRKDLHKVNQHISRKLTPLLRTRKGEIKHPKPDKAVAFGLTVVLGAMNHQSLAGISTMKNEELVRELSDLLLRYLRIQTQ